MNLFDEFSTHYDKMVNWTKRLEREGPFLRKVFQEHTVKRVLDLACGTGHHAVMLAQWGYEVTAMDLSRPMVDRAKEEAARAGVSIAAKEGGLLDFQQKLSGKYEAILVLGNSLPHLLTLEDIQKALTNAAKQLAPGGCLIIQNRNYDRVLLKEERFMPLSTWQGEDGQESLFFRFNDFQGELIQFNLVALDKSDGKWTYQVGSNPLRPIKARELAEALAKAGLNKLQWFGDYSGNAYNSEESGDLIVVAGKS